MISSVSIRDTLHFLGWKGTPLDPGLLEQIMRLRDHACAQIEPRVTMSRFVMASEGALEGTTFSPQGEDVKKMLTSCHEAVLLAVTLGAHSERLLLKEQAVSAANAVLLDAVLSAAIEAVCDQQENLLRRQLSQEGLYLTDRFSPGYGDMPLSQSREICAVLETDKRIGLTVSQTGIMIPRKSVTAVMGISRVPVKRRPSDCEICSMRDVCALRRQEQP